MSKKIIFAIILALTPLLFSFARADFTDLMEFSAVSDTVFDQASNDQPFWRLSIVAKQPDVINVKSGLNFVLNEGEPIQWDREKTGVLKITGNAAPKIKSAEPTVYDNLYVLHLDVTDNFDKGDELYIEGMVPRTYKHSLSSRQLGLDVTGDMVPDIYNAHVYSVKSVAQTDFIVPYDPTDFSAVYNDAKKRVEINWKNPADYDFWQVVLTRERMVNGKKQKLDIYSGPEESFIDTSIINGEVTYYLYAVDQYGNNSGLLKRVIDVGTAATEPPPDETSQPAEEKPAPKVSVSEKSTLTKLLSYYYVRYQIKCLAATADPTSSLCLWSRIDLIYAQKVVGTIKASIYLTENDIRLMALRVRWPEARYQTKCVETDVPDKTCPALEQSLKRIHYFID